MKRSSLALSIFCLIGSIGLVIAGGYNFIRGYKGFADILFILGLVCMIVFSIIAFKSERRKEV